MLSVTKLAALALASAMLAGCAGTWRQAPADSGSPVCRLGVAQLAAETDPLRRVEITEGLIRSGCVRRPRP